LPDERAATNRARSVLPDALEFSTRLVLRTPDEQESLALLGSVDAMELGKLRGIRSLKASSESPNRSVDSEEAMAEAPNVGDGVERSDEQPHALNRNGRRG
jgi:hypothetical protein